MRDVVGCFVIVGFFAVVLLMARRTESPTESLAENLIWLGKASASFIGKTFRFGSSFTKQCFYWLILILVALVGGAACLSAIAFFGYGAFRGIVMFLTLAPVSILAGFVLFFVSVVVGLWVVAACLSCTLALVLKIAAGADLKTSADLTTSRLDS